MWGSRVLEKQKTGIVTLGHLLIDHIALVQNKFIENLGLERPVYHTNSAELRKILTALQNAPEEMIKSHTKSLGGGVAICAKTLASLGIKTTLLGSVGADEDAEFLRHALDQYGILYELGTSPKATGVFCSMQTESNAKWLVVSPEAARDVRGMVIDEKLWSNNEILYIDGLLIDDVQWLSSIADSALRHGLILAMDASTADNARFNRDILISFAEKYCTYVFANEREYSELKLTSQQLASSKVHWIVKRGPKGATAIFQNKVEHASSYTATKIVDDTCAGDAFAGGFLYGLMMGLPVRHCLSLGNSAGSLAVMSCGSLFEQSAMRKTLLTALDRLLL